MDSPRHPQAIYLAIVALVLSGICFLLFPVVRPFFDEATLSGAHGFASVNWIIAHVLGIAALILIALGFLGLYMLFQDPEERGKAFAALILCWVGAGLTLPFLGAETFGLNVIGNAAIEMNNPALIPLVHLVRYGPGIAFIALGVILVDIAAIILAVAIWRSRMMLRWSGIPLAVGLLLFLPLLQGNPMYQTPRIADGALILIGCALIAWAAWRRAGPN